MESVEAVFLDEQHDIHNRGRATNVNPTGGPAVAKEST